MKERYHITGMTCSACSAHVEKAVRKLEGVEKVSVNLLTESMEVIYGEGTLDGQDIKRAVEKAGYGAALLTGRTQGSTDKGKRAGTGQSANACSLAENGASQRGCPDIRGEEAAAEPGSGRGGRKTGRHGLRQKAGEEALAMKRRLIVSAAFLLPLMYVAMYHMYYEWFGIPIPSFIYQWFHGSENAVTFAMTQFLLLLPVLYVNRKFFSVGFKTLGHFSPNMDSLIALGASAAIAYGIFALYRISYGLGHGDMALVEQYSHDLYFESAGMILTLITVGKYLESRSKGKTSEAITKLMDLSPKMAVLLRDGAEVEVPTEELQAGDIFLVKPGSLVPADGTVVEGYSSIDEAAITGESLPVEKHEGDKVVSATINKAGFLKCRADRVGEDTTLSQIIRLMEEAGASKAPIAQLADKVAGIFVPVVIGIALITLAVWLLAGAGVEFAVSTAIAVLVISCPCALGLATPVAIMVGTGVGAGEGILIKSGEALQQAREIDTVVMDKTGTITAGKLKVAEAGVWEKDMSVDTMLQIAAALEKKSEHPLAEAIVEYAESRHLPVPEVKDFRAVFGRGVEGRLAEDLPLRPLVSDSDDGPTAKLTTRNKKKSFAKGDETGHSQGETEGFVRGGSSLPAGEERKDTGGQEVREGTKCIVGNLPFMEENGISINRMIAKGMERIGDEGMTPLLVAAEGRFLGIIGVADEVKPTSGEAVRRFQEMGIRVVMLTGDNKRTAEAVRRRLDIYEVVAEVLPQDKEKKIRELKSQGHKVAMIGDGINDAPALAAADVGMAIGAGTDVAMESADIILMKSDLRDAVTAIRLSRAVIRNIKENLFWAFFYNVIGIPLAAGVWYPVFGVKLNPMFGAAAMSLSSIFVVGNALRLKRFKNRKGTKEEQKALLQHTQEDGGAALTEFHAEKEETKMTKKMIIEGMMCGHCTGRVQKALEALEGVKAVTMSLENKQAVVEADSEVTNETLTAAVTEAGYEVKEITDEK